MRQLLILAMVYPICCFSQSSKWESIGKFSGSASIFFEDTTADNFFIGGEFLFYNEDTMRGIGIWNGTNLTNLGCGFDWDCVNPNTWGGVFRPTRISKYDSKIYIGGLFKLANGKTVNGLTWWDGSDFQQVGTGMKGNGGTAGVCWSMSIINDELYVGGTFDSIAGIAVNSLGKYDGQEWSTVHALPRFEPTNPNFVNAIAEHKETLYVGGNFHNLPMGTINDLVKWNGVEWEGIPGFEEPSVIVDMVIYKDQLYVSGDFHFTGDGVQNGYDIVRSDGVHWYDVGGGVLGGQIDKMVTDGNYLYVAGGFNLAGDIPCNNLARWDGNQWCSFNSEFDSKVGAIGFYRDTMYIGGGFWSIDGDTSLAKVTRYIGVDSLFPCSEPVGIYEVHNEKDEFWIFPNPTSNEISIECPLLGKITIINELGQHVESLMIQNRKQLISTAHLSSGIYFITFQAEEMMQTKKLLIKH